MIKFMSFSSGSCGNCYWLGNDEKGILIDTGVSLRHLKKLMLLHGLDENSFSSILVTHDHMDHIRSLGSFCKRLQKPVYATTLLHEALIRHSYAMPSIMGCRRDLREGEWNDVDGFMVHYFVVPHDATQTVGYAIEFEGLRFVIMTDVGRMTDEAVEFASKADVVVVESNYDVDMLMGGSYPHDLKMRICQGNGHLSNDECAAAIKRFWHEGLRFIFLCHLSENNNTPTLAYETSKKALDELGVSDKVQLAALPRQYPSRLYVIG